MWVRQVRVCGAVCQMALVVVVVSLGAKTATGEVGFTQLFEHLGVADEVAPDFGMLDFGMLDFGMLGGWHARVAIW